MLFCGRGLFQMAGAGSYARVYMDVNTHKPRDYWDYESHPIDWGLASFIVNVIFHLHFSKIWTLLHVQPVALHCLF